MDLEFALRHSYRVVRTELLLRCGLSTADIRKRVADGTLQHVRHGWYTTDGHHHDVVTAVRAGGVLSCVSALRKHGIWTPTTGHIHVRPTNHARYRGRGPSTVRGSRLCGRKTSNYRPATAVDPLLVALSAAVGCVSEEELVAIMDSMLHSRRVDLDGIRTALKDHPKQIRSLIDYVDPKAESGTESLVRFRLARVRVKMRSQVQVPGVGRVDLLIGNQLIIEVDSRAHHTGEEAYESDRRRDRRAATLRYVVVRVTYHQVLHQWDEVLADILTMIRQRMHLHRAGSHIVGSHVYG